MLRLTGAALLVGAGALLRQTLFAREQKTRRTLRALAHAFSALAQAVRLTLTPLPALLRTAPCEREARRFFDAVLDGLSRGETLASAWASAAAALPFQAREREAAAALGGLLDGEEESVCAALTQTAQALADAESALAGTTAQRGRVMTALCLGGGTLLAIVLL